MIYTSRQYLYGATAGVAIIIAAISDTRFVSERGSSPAYDYTKETEDEKTDCFMLPGDSGLRVVCLPAKDYLLR